MRITILNQFYAPDISPTAHMAASLAEHRASLGDEVTVVAGRGSYLGGSVVGSDAPPPRLAVRRLWTPGFGKASALARILDYLGFFLAAAWRLTRLPPQDVIVSLTTPPYIAWTAVFHKRRQPNVRLVLWSMDCYPDVLEEAGVIRKQGVLSRTLRALNRALFRRLDALVCLDEAMRERLLSQYVRDGAGLDVEVIPNWERLSLFRRDQAVAAWTPGTALGDRLRILYLGNAGAGHGFETVLEAARLLRDDPAVFLFVGGGSQWSFIDRRARELGLRNVVLHDYLPKQHTPSVMAGADCALITLRDSMRGVISPSKLHANLAMALPVIYVGPPGTNVDHAIERFGCGVSLREGEAPRLVEFVRRLNAEPLHRQTLGQRARAAFEQAYSDAVGLPRFDALLDALQQRRGLQGSNSSATP